MRNNNSMHSFILVVFILGLLFFIFARCQTFDEKIKQSVSLALDEKQRGAHVFASFDSTDFIYLDQLNIKWVTVVPWGFQKDFDSPKVSHHNGDSLMIRQSDSSWVKQLELLHDAGFNVFVKPHVWLNNPTSGKWRSAIFPSTEENWLEWKRTYREFILRYARVAETAKTAMFCIGTEFSRLAIEKPNFW